MLEFCYWKANWWFQRLQARPGVSAELEEGLRAYALEQIARERAWAEAWTVKWKDVRARAGLVVRDHLVNVEEEVLVPLEVELDDDAQDEFEPDGEYEEEEL